MPTLPKGHSTFECIFHIFPLMSGELSGQHRMNTGVLRRGKKPGIPQLYVPFSRRYLEIDRDGSSHIHMLFYEQNRLTGRESSSMRAHRLGEIIFSTQRRTSLHVKTFIKKLLHFIILVGFHCTTTELLTSNPPLLGRICQSEHMLCRKYIF